MTLMKIIGYMFIAYIAIAILCGAFLSVVEDPYKSTSAQEVIPTAIPEQTKPSIKEGIIIHQDGQDKIVECGRLSVFGDNNAIQIANDDIEKIIITGHGNVISYSYDANPQIRDYGDYNDVWQRWLT